MGIINDRAERGLSRVWSAKWRDRRYTLNALWKRKRGNRALGQMVLSINSLDSKPYPDNKKRLLETGRCAGAGCGRRLIMLLVDKNQSARTNALDLLGLGSFGCSDRWVYKWRDFRAKVE